MRRCSCSFADQAADITGQTIVVYGGQILPNPWAPWMVSVARAWMPGRAGGRR